MRELYRGDNERDDSTARSIPSLTGSLPSRRRSQASYTNSSIFSQSTISSRSSESSGVPSLASPDDSTILSSSSVSSVLPSLTSPDDSSSSSGSTYTAQVSKAVSFSEDSEKYSSHKSDNNLFGKSSIMWATLSFDSLEKEGVGESLVTETFLKADYKEANPEEYTMFREDLTLQEQVALL